MYFKITLSDGIKEGVYSRVDETVEQACDFQPVRMNDDFLTSPWPCTKVIKVEEIEVVICLEADGEESYYKTWKKMEDFGFHVTKTVGAFCLQVIGKGSVIEDIASNLCNHDARNSCCYILSSNLPIGLKQNHQPYSLASILAGNA
jgi:hypothetical protein